MPFNQSAQYTYDELNRLSAVTYGTDWKIIYTYDPAGNSTSVTVELSAGQESASLPTAAPLDRRCPNPRCGRTVPPGKSFCTACGTRITEGACEMPAASHVERRCPKCNQIVLAGKKFCARDGTPVL